MTVLKAKGHSADTGAGKFPLVSMGGRAEGLQTRERGPPSALAEIFSFLFTLIINNNPYVMFLEYIHMGQNHKISALTSTTGLTIKLYTELLHEMNVYFRKGAQKQIGWTCFCLGLKINFIGK